jgi:hypothetical protein
MLAAIEINDLFVYHFVFAPQANSNVGNPSIGLE